MWSVRVRTTVASTVVVTVCLIAAGAALLAVLYNSLETSARSAADARADQIVGQLTSDTPSELDATLLSTDGQIGAVQIIDTSGAVLAGSLGDTALLSPVHLPTGQSQDLGRTDVGESDLWTIARGARSPAGPVTVVVGADREPVEKVVTTVATLLALVGPIVAGLVAFATYKLVGIALRPVERIRHRVSSITNRQLDERVPIPPSRDEIARLAVTMNEMLGRLHDGHQAQQRFVSDASHELRSPLTTITTALELAASRPNLLDAELIDDSLLPEARRMRRLIEDLLLLARTDEHHRTPVRSVDVDLDDVLLAESARISTSTTLAVRTSITPVRVSGDPSALARLLRNIVDNAVRHAESSITLSCSTFEERARIVVEDDGPGIAAEDRERVFGRFVRLDESRAREQGGTGLGLAIVAEIAADHHGVVSIDRAPGGGARVTVDLPL